MQLASLSVQADRPGLHQEPDPLVEEEDVSVLDLLVGLGEVVDRAAGVLGEVVNVGKRHLKPLLIRSGTSNEEKNATFAR